MGNYQEVWLCEHCCFLYIHWYIWYCEWNILRPLGTALAVMWVAN